MKWRFYESPQKIFLYFEMPWVFEDPRLRELDAGLQGLCRHAASVSKRIVVDFRGIDFLNSAAIGQLVILNKIAKQEQADLRIAN